jgi:alpha-L-fucosidase
MRSRELEGGSKEMDWSRFNRAVPTWFRDAKLGIFVHWGAYSVPAWAEPIGELGGIDDATWFRHNPYAEWYWNTIRLSGSPAQRYHEKTYENAPYDDFLDAWKAEYFDPDGWAELFARTGARYVIPTSKHHDGIALWDAPGTFNRNTVWRGPHRDLIGELAAAVRRQGIRFGVYYSGGLDWSIYDPRPLSTASAVQHERPVDSAYAAYCFCHLADLIKRYEPDVLWNDIEWPDAGKHDSSLGLGELFKIYYESVPHGVVNDRFGNTHWDFKTSEYRAHRESEASGAWEHCRGLGLSFGYNRVETAEHMLTPRALVRLFVDVASRGGNLLLNVGPTAEGLIPDVQRRLLEEFGSWNSARGQALFGSRPLDDSIARPSDEPWARWVGRGEEVWGFVDATGPVVIGLEDARVQKNSGALADGTALAAEPVPGGLRIEIPEGPAMPTAFRFLLRR